MIRSRKPLSLVAAIALASTLFFLLLAVFALAQPEVGNVATSPQRPAAISVTFPSGPWPWYVQEGMWVEPYPPMVDHPTEICVVVDNAHPTDHVTVTIEFSVGELGIGLELTPVGEVVVVVPPAGEEIGAPEAEGCVVWMPEVSGSQTIEARLIAAGSEDQVVQRALVVDEPLVGGDSFSRVFAVRNPFTDTLTITMGLIDHVGGGWNLEVLPGTLTDMAAGESRPVTVTMTPPLDLPPDGTPIVDVEGLVAGEVIGGFRFLFRPPVPLHRFPDPPYAESEISIHPYPLRVGEPTEVCVELRNLTPDGQNVFVQFAWSQFGIGMPFFPINGARPVHLPPHSIVQECIHWVPPVSGQARIRVELEQEGYHPQWSEHNLDVDEPLLPLTPHELRLWVQNPFTQLETIDLVLIPHIPGWGFGISPQTLPSVDGGAGVTVTLTVTPPADLPPDGTPLLDVEAHAGPGLIGGFRKIFRPPITLHPFPDPFYAEREISIDPYPVRVGEPTEVCVELRNPTSTPQDVFVHFAWSEFGIGMPFIPINGPRPVHLPPHSLVRECIHWIPPLEGQVCLQVELEVPGQEIQVSRRNIDADEPLEPLTSHARSFIVRNPFDHPVTITLGLIPHFPDWGLELSEDVLPDVGPGLGRTVTMTVTPPADLPGDGDPIVDVEAYADGELIGGFRKIFRPPVPVHQPRDPVYAEREIFVHPYPPREREPTEVGAEIRNPTEQDQTVTVTFSYAEFGIGLPFNPINEPMVITVPAGGLEMPATVWIPPHEGLWCFQVEIQIPGSDDVFWSRRNIDVGEPLEPGVPHSLDFPVGVWPYTETMTVTLGLVNHLEGWTTSVAPEVVRPGPDDPVMVRLTVTPPADLPGDGAPIVDVEAFVDGELIGGFRKIFRPPVPVHRPRDPVYAESEIGVSPYPVITGHPTELSVEVFNPTEYDEIVTVTFSVAPFGIGLPFTTTNIIPNPIAMFVPAMGAARGHTIWHPNDWHGKVCIRVELAMEGQDDVFWSHRNIDVGEPLEPGMPHSLDFAVGVWPYTDTMTVTLGLVNHREGWGASLTPDVVRPEPESPVTVTLTVTPPVDVELGIGEPIVDVEAFVDGMLLGGFRKLDIPPVPLHQLHEKGYAESEITIDPYPPEQGQATRISTAVQNSSDVSMTIRMEFGWAKFGMGIPFSTTGMSPISHTVTIYPHMTRTVWVTWTPTSSGHQCVRVLLHDTEDRYEPQESQRNVDVAERTICGTNVFSFTVYNDSLFTNTVDLGMITFNVPPSWEVTTIPTGTLQLGPGAEGVVMVVVKIPCPSSSAPRGLDAWRMRLLQEEAGSIPTVDVEGYVGGDLVGGIELQFMGRVEWPAHIYLPTAMRGW